MVGNKHHFEIHHQLYTRFYFPNEDVHVCVCVCLSNPCWDRAQSGVVLPLLDSSNAVDRHRKRFLWGFLLAELRRHKQWNLKNRKCWGGGGRSAGRGSWQEYVQLHGCLFFNIIPKVKSVPLTPAMLKNVQLAYKFWWRKSISNQSKMAMLVRLLCSVLSEGSH